MSIATTSGRPPPRGEPGRRTLIAAECRPTRGRSSEPRDEVSARKTAGRKVRAMKGDRVEAVVDTGQGVQHFEIVATRNGRRIEVTTARGVVEVTEVTRGGTPVRTGRFMASRLIALVEHPAREGETVEVETRRRMGTKPPTAPRAEPVAGLFDADGEPEA